jgi:hypothetical protein
VKFVKDCFTETKPKPFGKRKKIMGTFGGVVAVGQRPKILTKLLGTVEIF